MILLKVTTAKNAWFSILIFNHGFKFQDHVSNVCYDLSMLCLNISNIAIITVKNVDYCCIIHNNVKSEATDLLKNSVPVVQGYL